MIVVGRTQVALPPRRCAPEDVERAAARLNRPFVVLTPRGGRFSTRQRVFLELMDVRVECCGGAELRFACKLLSEIHNRRHGAEDDGETERMEAAARAHMEAPDSDADEAAPKEDEDISLQEWEQLGYKWFKREDVTYI
jgi:hypothetical protein